MYTRAFGLKEKPFSITPDPGYLYLGSRHREALAHLVYGVRERAGFVQLTGEVGTGKTLLTRALLDRLPGHVDVALVYRPGGTVADFLIAIFRELGIAPPQRRHSLRSLVDRLNEHLLASHARGRTTVLLIDEAQNLRPELIEQLRLLTNLETAREKLLHIVLVGQPELDRLLRRRELRQVSQRIAARYHLLPLTRAETAAYVQHRLRVAGAGRALFTRPALYWLHRVSGGVPRLINVIADRALLGAWTAGRPDVGLRELRQAASEVGASPLRRRWQPWAVAAVGIVAGSALAVALWYPLWRGAEAEHSAGLPGVSLDAHLQGVDDQASLERAFADLSEIWETSLPAADQPPCRSMRDAGLRCHYGADGWTGLRQFDQPAIVELTDAAGNRHSAVLTALGDDRVTLSLAGESFTVSRRAFDQRWSGDYLLLWRPIGLNPLPAGRGDQGSAVLWLRQRLGDQDTTFGPHPDRFDDELAERVREYQQTRGLPVTGRLDERTLLHLQAAQTMPGPALRQEAL